MKFVLQLKHWQFFLITFAVPMTGYLIMMGTIFATMMNNPSMDEFPVEGIVGGVILFLSYLVSITFSIAWAWHLATGLYKKLPAGHTMKIKRFYVAFFFPMFYIGLFIIGGIAVAFAGMNGVFDSLGQSDEVPGFVWLIFLVIPLHFFAMACMFYILYFLSKSLRTVELQRQATSNDYISEFIMLWFSFVGIWFLQPRINKIFSNEPPSPPIGGPLDRL
jgi:hypothetical protein